MLCFCKPKMVFESLIFLEFCSLVPMALLAGRAQESAACRSTSPEAE